ncbi:6325_t:CDS:2, partial [Paraglomus brasilianum]
SDGSIGLFPANYVRIEPEAYDHVGEEDSGYMAVAIYSYTTDEPDEISFTKGAIITNITFESDNWWHGTASDGSIGLFPANYVEIIEPEVYDHTGEEDSGYMAVAIYSCTADKPDEISFTEGAVITNITFEYDDWWQGTAPDGSIGLFPANYVELSQE